MTRFAGACVLVLLVWAALLAGLVETAWAETSGAGAAPQLPPPSKLKTGKLQRGSDGVVELVPPSSPVESSDPAAASDLPSGVSEISDAPNGSSTPAEPPTAEAPALPPEATRKKVTPLRLPSGELAAVPRLPKTLKVCPPQSAGPGCDHLSLADAVAQAKPGDTVLLAPGIYHQAVLITVPELTVKGEPGAHLKGRAVEGKAALVVRADDVVIDGIECSEIRVRDRNGACVRIEGHDITIRNVYFHDNQTGVLGGMGGTVLIEDSVFERNGSNGGFAHGLYILREVELFHFRRSKVLSTKEEGQGVKSRAVRTIIEDSVIAGLEARDSRAIDIPNGGEIVVRRNILQKGPNSSNSGMMGFGLEGKLHDVNRASVTENVIIFDQDRPAWIDRVNEYLPIAPPRGTVVASRIGDDLTVRDNIVVAAREIVAQSAAVPPGNRTFATRSQAGLPWFPELPGDISDVTSN